jgi:hypothetical protein
MVIFIPAIKNDSIGSVFFSAMDSPMGAAMHSSFKELVSIQEEGADRYSVDITMYFSERHRGEKQLSRCKLQKKGCTHAFPALELRIRRIPV